MSNGKPGIIKKGSSGTYEDAHLLSSPTVSGPTGKLATDPFGGAVRASNKAIRGFCPFQNDIGPFKDLVRHKAAIE
jgi:hypothetical protein